MVPFSSIHPLTLSFVHSVTDSLTGSPTDSLAHSLTYLRLLLRITLFAVAPTRSCTAWLTDFLAQLLLTHFLTHFFTRSFVHSFIHLLAHLPTCSFSHSFIHLLMHSPTDLFIRFIDTYLLCLLYLLFLQSNSCSWSPFTYKWRIAEEVSRQMFFQLFIIEPSLWSSNLCPCLSSVSQSDIKRNNSSATASVKHLWLTKLYSYDHSLIGIMLFSVVDWVWHQRFK